MGGYISRGKGDDDDQEEITRRYELKLQNDGTFGYSDELDKREIIWWERLLFDKRFRITYVVILGILLGIIIPYIIFATKLENNDRTIYGSCMIKEHAKFQCLINSVAIEDEDTCTKALCCWQNSDALPFKCYHSFPSAYQYTVSESNTGSGNGTTWTDLSMQPNQRNLMSSLRVRLRWVTEGHVFLEFFNPSLAEAEVISPVPGEGGTVNQEALELSVEHAEYDGFFFIRIFRSDTGETIFDTRLGTVVAAQNYITLSTALPTPYFYGLRGGQSALASVVYGVVNGFENAELPFYIASENSGKWHGVLIETTDPMLVKVVQAPGIMFHLETDIPKLNLHLFTGPTQPEIFSQLYQYIQQKHGITHAPFIPPFWGLGLHLCRRVHNISIAHEHIEKLFNTVTGIPYDSDCIDENLRRPFFLNPEFGDISETLELLTSKPKRILLSQRVTVPWDDESNDELPFIMDATNSSNIVNFMGTLDNETVKYIDTFHPNFSNFHLPTDIPFSGISLVDNYPKLNNATGICFKPQSKIQSYFIDPISNSNSSINASMLWGSVCPEAVHISNGTTNSHTRHLKLHNTYGHQSLKVLYNSLQPSENITDNTDDLMITSASVWITSMYYGGYNGLQVPFTWRGLQDSIAYTVRNYVLAPIIGTPICGSSVFNMSLSFNEDLCLRWFQFGLLLPLSMNSYDGHSSYGPNHLSEQYRDYLEETIYQRYTFSPYYYTVLKQYQKNYIPFLRPMSFEFSSGKDRNWTLPILNQFMIGDAILAAPIIDIGVSRTAYFPSGVWYTKEGLEAWHDNDAGRLQLITGHITETPMFFRGGYIIPTLQDLTVKTGHRIEDSLKEKYTLLIALSSPKNNGDAHQYAIGSLTATDGLGHFEELVFNATYINQTLTIVQNLTNDAHPDNNSWADEVSTTVDRFRIYGLPTYGRLEISIYAEHANYTITNYTYLGDGDQLALHVSNLDLNWRKSKVYEVIIRKKSEDPSTTTTDSDITTDDETLPPSSTIPSTLVNKGNS